MSEYDVDMSNYKCEHCGLYYRGYEAWEHGVGKCVGPWK